jgi:hypothetical protein
MKEATEEEIRLMLETVTGKSVVRRVDAIGGKLPPMSAAEALALGIAIITGIRTMDEKVGVIAESAAVAALTHSLNKAG